MKEFVGLRAKIYIYLKDNNDEDKKVKGTKKCDIKRKLKFQSYKKFSKTAQIENKINHLKPNKINVDSLRRSKIIYKNNKLILKNTAKI